MNTFALGFVGTPRGTTARDSYFIGSSNNPSKKGSMIAVARPVAQPRRLEGNPSSAEKKKGDMVVNDASTLAKAPADAATPPHANSLTMLERRCEFLELQAKRQSTTLADQSLYIKNLEEKLVEPSNLFCGWLNGMVLRDTLEFHITDIGKEPDCAGEGVVVDKGMVVNICYPMKTWKDDNENTRILMCRRRVDPATGQVLMSWIVVYSGGEVDKEDVRHVGDFHL